MPVALIVDDNHFFLRMERILLERAGFHVADAQDGEEGYAVFRDHAPRLDIVITDLMMPKLPGDELCRRIKRERPELPVVLLTGIGAERGKAHTDFDAVVFKPLEPGFIELLRSLIADAKRRREISSAG